MQRGRINAAAIIPARGGSKRIPRKNLVPGRYAADRMVNPRGFA
jgi:hypothetical protein